MNLDVCFPKALALGAPISSLSKNTQSNTVKHRHRGGGRPLTLGSPSLLHHSELLRNLGPVCEKTAAAGMSVRVVEVQRLKPDWCRSHSGGGGSSFKVNKPT